MKKYVKEIDGKKVYKYRNEVILSKDGMNIYNPTEEMLFEDGWQVYEPVQEEHIQTEEEFLAHEMNIIKERILEHDASDVVNRFYINDMPLWLDKMTRTGLILRFNAEIESGMISTSLWHEGVEFPLLLDNAVKMLYAIEIYASKCYDNTQKHIKNIKEITDINELRSYDYKSGYPEYLYF